MADETIVVKKEETPIPPSLPETQLNMAVAFGQMTKTNEQLIAEVTEAKAERNQTNALLQTLVNDIQEMKSHQATTSHQMETLKESQTDILSAAMVDSEKEESDVIPVTPMVEKKLEYTETPVTANQSFISRLIFGKKGR